MTLIERLRAASGPDRELFEEAFRAVFPQHYAGVGTSGFGPSRWARFSQLLDAEAWLEAVLTLLPEGWRPYLAQIADRDWSVSLTCDRQDDLHCKGNAAIPAIALLIAILQAKGIE